MLWERIRLIKPMKRARPYNTKSPYKKKRRYSNNNIKTIVKKELNQLAEKKFRDITVGDSPTVTAGLVITGLSALSDGTNSITKIGNKVTIHKVMYKGVVTLPSTSLPTQTSDVVRLIVFVDKAPASTPTVAGASDGVLAAATVYSYKNIYDTQRYTTVIDELITICSSTGSYDGTNDQYGQVDIPFEFYKNTNINVKFDAAASPTTNSLNAIIISQNGLAIVEGTSRIRYTDV